MSLPIAVESVTASPTTLAPGGKSTITPLIKVTDEVATVTIHAPDGSTATCQVTVTPPVAFSVDPADIGTKVVATVDQGGTLVLGADGVSFELDAS